MLDKMLRLIFLYLILGISAADSEDRFTLPSNKSSTVNCQNTVLAIHQGRITSGKMIHFPDGNFEVHFEINDKDSVDWFVTCDGLTGKILKDIKLNEEK